MAEDRIGQRFGRLTVVAKSPRSGGKHTYWDCVCDCGGEIAPRSDALSSGRAKGCGCLQKEAASRLCISRSTHGRSRTKVYRAWCHMKGRCYDPNDDRYTDYGGRGIGVCERWQVFENFLADMGDPPPGMTLERLNTNKDYSAENCMWADWLTQNRNRRISVRVRTSDGLLPVKEYAKMEGISYNAARGRAYRKMVPTVRVGELV